MRKKVEVSEMALKSLKDGVYVEGSLQIDKQTGMLTFKMFNRKAPKHRKDRVIALLEHGWLKASSQRIKFYNSVNKDIGTRLIDLAMHRELKTAMDALKAEDYLNNV